MENRLLFNGASENIINLAVNALIRPRETVRYLQENNPKRHRYILVYLLGLNSVTGYLAADGFSFSLFLAVTLMFAPIIAGLIRFYGIGWVMSLSGRMLGGKASCEDMRLAVLWSAVPLLMITPVCLLTTLPGAKNFDAVIENSLVMILSFVVLYVVELVISVWCAVNFVKMVSEVQGFPASKALLSMIIAIGIIYAVCMVIAFFYVILGGAV